MKVKDIFQFDALKDAKCIAGSKGLNEQITSISVLEVAEVKIKSWVLVNQLYITSFYAIMQDIKMQIKVIKTLHEKGAAGIVICHIDLFLKEIDPKVIKLCEKLSFPLIVANNKSSYIEILNPIILKLVSNSNPKYKDTIHMQNKLIECIATKKDLHSTYRMMTEEYGDYLYFLDINNKLLYPKYHKNAEELINLLENHYNLIEQSYLEKGYYITMEFKSNYIILPIKSGNLVYGTIIGRCLNNDITSCLPILNSIASISTLIYTNSSRLKEIEIAKKQEYVNNLITWNFRNVEVAIKLGLEIGWNILNKEIFITINLNDIQNKLDIDNKDFIKLVNEILYRKIKSLVKSDNENNLVALRSDMFIILLESNDMNINTRAKKLSDNLLDCCKETLNGSISIGISGIIENCKDIPRAYRESSDTTKIGRYFLGENKVVCYDDIGFYGIFNDIININKFKNIKNNIFKDLKDYDKEQNTHLYQTLKVLIYNNMNSQKSAEDLYVHKNTVNYRKNKIMELLGYEPWNMPYLLNTILSIVSDYFIKVL